MNQYLIGIYKGVLSNPQLTELMEFSSNFSNNLITTISISAPENLTLFLGIEESQLTAGLTDQFYLLINELQKLEKYVRNFYFVYDYRNRKLVENPMEKCFPLIELTLTGSNLQNLIQTVKDIKQDVFAGFKINSEESGLLKVEVLLTSPLLEMIHSGGAIPESLRSDKHYLYLKKLTDLLSNDALCSSVQTKVITG
ncbi:hypothetical protein V7201_09600 [Bacillus sp. JJ1122]|uniref:hypothetical protein n=1 Tax=Bacillus sp. JJ1122 TaxID=3122951 RepID=UPI0030006BBE